MNLFTSEPVSQSAHPCLRLEPTGFDLMLDGRVILRHREDCPLPLRRARRGAHRHVPRQLRDRGLCGGAASARPRPGRRRPHLLRAGRGRPLAAHPDDRVLGGRARHRDRLRRRRSAHRPHLAPDRHRARRARLGRRRADVLPRPLRPAVPVLDLGARGRARQEHRHHLPGRHAPARRAATTGPPTTRSPPTSPRAAMRCMWRRRPIPPSTSAAAPSTRSRSGRCPSASSSAPATASPRSSGRCPPASAASRSCPTGSIRAPSSG